MADAVPEILYSIDRAGEPIAIIERQKQADRAGVLEQFPGLLTGEFTTELAKLVNHFAREFQYEVIEDPDAFAQAYRQRLDAEGSAEWEEGNPKLRDFGVPAFEEIRTPVIVDGILTFFARSIRLGVPYKVTAEVEGASVGNPNYEPMSMSPVQ